MKKKLLIGVLALVMCFTLVGCGKTENNNNNNSNNNQKENSTKAEKTVTSEAKTSASKYKIDTDKLPVEYEVIDGYYQEENGNLELRVYLNKEYSKEEKINLHNSLVDYFKTVADDKESIYFNLPYVVNIISLKELVPSVSKELPKYSLLLLLNEVNIIEKSKVKIKQK